jgi:hypothetical protein
VAEHQETISFSKVENGWRVEIKKEQIFNFEAEGTALRLVRALQYAIKAQSRVNAPPPCLHQADTESDCSQPERLWTVRAYVDAWAIYETTIAAETAEEAKEIMRENRPAAWGTPEFSQFEHTEFEVDDDEGNTVIEQN